MSRPAALATRLLRRPLVLLAVLWLLLVLACALHPELVTGRDPVEQDLPAALGGPSAAHPLGTDRLGQDLLSRLAYGAAGTLWGVLVAVLTATVVGVGLGLLAGYLGGLVDALVGRLADLLFSLPAIVILLVVVAVFPGDVTIAMLTFGLLLSSGLIRVVRAATRSTREELFIAAARLAGLSAPQILRRHVLPRLRGLVIVQASLVAAVALVMQASLAFLGFGPPPPEPSWGGMIDEARMVIVRHPWALVPPGLAVALTVLSFVLLGDAARDGTTAAWSTTKLARRRRRPGRTGRHRVGVTPAAPTAVPASPAPDALLSVRGLSVRLPGRPDAATPDGTTVVSDVDLDIAPGEIVGLVGESGCGKTVTALSVLGLPPGDGRVTGSCHFAGLDLVRATDRQWRTVRGRRIGYVAQDPMVSLDPTLRVGVQLAEAVRRHTGAGRRAARERVVALLRDVGLPEPDSTARRYPHQLSGGMAQRVAIAFALAGDPELLIADEPTTALDVTRQAEILALLARTSRERRLAVLLVTHDLGVVAALCDRAVVMYAGQVVESCPVTELFARPRHPYTRGLLAADPHRASGAGRLPTIAGTVPAPGNWPTGCRFAPRCPLAVEPCRRAPVPLDGTAPAHAVRCVRPDESRVAA
ncbi:dipeptide/oligopeptide/nickel ABC transporter permease/ATP-binding protein [Micromonospora humidisoli]|uniref:Dipeptide/oligopeptide/nickel ABC transporter permease/ATP-binding protein n=1 Tax=Micromonospora humidisoli TaxID=2807622 RepID=A0ABS2JIH6_9ACTN|nr:dipeptide/oligopeptide/nickel ABC transporter permease/ATP-binding protein [Micromonospora humidisoli]MBM7085259.1 dipeptide/oligopeptide/nickel ABC transporter permease/ATP-binding protein [Micromonospora humidisoli]